MVIINGEAVNAAGQTVSAYLAAAGFDPANVVVERNEEILPKEAYDAAILADDDRIEIVCFVGGG